MDPHRAYREAGVDIERAEELIGPLAARLFHTGPLPRGFFCHLFPLGAGQWLAATVDGIGTKTLLACSEVHYRWLARDLLAVVYNDLITSGLTPRLFLDYWGGFPLASWGEVVLEELGQLCHTYHMAFLGGESAEMPGVYEKEAQEFVGFGIALGTDEELFSPAAISEGDVLIGIPSSGFHANGFSLVRKVLTEKRVPLEKEYTFCGRKKALREHLLCPTLVYHDLLSLPWKGLAHISGGGIVGNVSRLLPERLAIRWREDVWDRPFCELFHWFQELAQISWREMLHIFNCGYGMVGVASWEEAQEILQNRSEWVELGRLEQRSK